MRHTYHPKSRSPSLSSTNYRPIGNNLNIFLGPGKTQILRAGWSGCRLADIVIYRNTHCKKELKMRGSGGKPVGEAGDKKLANIT